MNLASIKQALRPVLLLAGLGFILWMLADSWEQTVAAFSRVHWGWFVLSIALGVCDHLVVSRVFAKVLGKYQVLVARDTLLQMYFFGQIAKYIPGRVWSVLVQKMYLPVVGKTAELFFANIDVMLMFIARSVIVSAALILVLTGYWALAPMELLVGGLGFGVLARSAWLGRFAAWVRRRFLTGVVPERELTGRFPVAFEYLTTLALHLGSNFVMLVLAFGVDWHHAAIYLTFFGIAWIAGVLAIVFPGGLGVREGVFVALGGIAGTGLSIELLMTYAIVYRVWHLLQELSGVGLMWGLRGVGWVGRGRVA